MRLPWLPWLPRLPLWRLRCRTLLFVVGLLPPLLSGFALWLRIPIDDFLAGLDHRPGQFIVQAGGLLDGSGSEPRISNQIKQC